MTVGSAWFAAMAQARHASEDAGGPAGQTVQGGLGRAVAVMEVDLATTLDPHRQRAGLILTALGTVLIADLDRDIADPGPEPVERALDGAARYVGQLFGWAAIAEGDEHVHELSLVWNVLRIGYLGRIDKPKVSMRDIEKS